jgi:hypothetical protein
MAPRVCLSSMSTTSWLARVRPAGGRIHPPLLALHILSEGFHRIRYYGFLGNRHRNEKLEQCRHALGTVWLEETVSSERAEQDLSRPLRGSWGPSLWECPVCHRGRMIVIRAIAGGKYIWPRSIELLRFPTCPVPPECGVHAQRVRFAHVSNQVANFRGHVWSARTPSLFTRPVQSEGSTVPSAHCIGARTMCRLRRQPGHIARARPTKAGRSAGGANEAARSFAER